MKDIFDCVMDSRKLKGMSGLSLAYVGDAVYELMVRTWLNDEAVRTNGDLHAAAVRYVSAQAQAGAMERLLPVLTPEETEYFKRGRNARTGTLPAHATPGQYHTATGFEALFGFLWLTGRKDRLEALFQIITEEDHAS